MIEYINNNRDKNILLLHGLACNSFYYDELISSLSNYVNFIKFELVGHFEQKEIDFTIKEDIQKIIRFAKINNIEIDFILAHSISSILSLLLIQNMKEIKKVFFLEGNIIPEDYSWSSSLSSMNYSSFENYWKRYQKNYVTFLKLNIKRKLDFSLYKDRINLIRTKNIYNYCKNANDYKYKMNEFIEYHSKIIYIQSIDNELFHKKVDFCKKNKIKYYNINNSSHFMMLDSIDEISMIIKKEI